MSVLCFYRVIMMTMTVMCVLWLGGKSGTWGSFFFGIATVTSVALVAFSGFQVISLSLSLSLSIYLSLDCRSKKEETRVCVRVRESL